MPQYLTILFADIANSTWLYQNEGDALAHRKVTQCLRRLRGSIEQFDGRLLRTVGDAVLASFDNADDAHRSAVDMQRVHQHTELSLRVGFHYGEVIPDQGDVYGNAVNIAARVAAYANANEIFTTQQTVDRLTRELAEVTEFLDRVDFKGIVEPLPVYRLHWADASVDTRIVTAVDRTQRVGRKHVLELLIDARRVRVDQSKPIARLGRSVDNDIVVNHESTSRHHAVIEFLRGKFQLRDCSTNGTYVSKGGRPSVFIRREQLMLDEFGVFGLGWNPVEDRQHAVSFRLVALESSARDTAT